MKNKPELDELFEAARRCEADVQRQQHLNAMIDRLAAAEADEAQSHANHRRVWPVVGVAASILLLVGIGLRFIVQDESPQSQGMLVAEANPVIVVVTDTAEVPDASVPSFTHPVHSQRASVVLAENKVALSNEPVQSVEPVLPDESILPDELDQPDEPLLAEEVAVPEEKNDSKPHRVFERTSSRLVCGEGCTPEPRRNTSGDAPQFAFFNASGTGTSVELGNLSF